MNLEAEFTDNLSGTKFLIINIINKYCSRFPEHIKKDLFQDIVLGAWKSYTNFRGECKFSSWMGVIATRACIDHLRRTKTAIKTIALDNLFYELVSDLPYYEPSLSVLDTLSNTERKTINLYIEGKSYKEISAITGESENKLRVRVCRIKEVLKRRVAEMEETESY
jgi:DNA-directed RNA polymerase specialized sigma24 family protein